MNFLSLRSRAISIVAGLISAVLLASCTLTGNVSPATEKVKIAYLPVVHSLPLYVALEKGYFKDEGLEVETIKFEAPNQIIDALLSGQVDIGAPGTAAGITAVSQSKKPNSLRIFAVSGIERGKTGTRNEAFLVPNNSAIASITDLKGKRLGILPGIQWRTISKHLLGQNGLSIDTDVTLVELAVPLQAQALASGQVDALLAIEPVPTIVVSKNIGRILIESPVGSIADPIYTGVGDVSVSFEQAHPATVQKVLRAFAKATQEIMRDPDAARPYLKGYTPLDDSLIQQVPMLTWKMRSEMTPNDVAGLQKFFDIFTEHGVIDGRMDAEQLLISESLNGQ